MTSLYFKPQVCILLSRHLLCLTWSYFEWFLPIIRPFLCWRWGSLVVIRWMWQIQATLCWKCPARLWEPFPSLYQISMHLQLKELLNTNNVIFQVRQTEWNGRKCSDYSQKGATPPWLAYFYEEETGCCWKNDCFSARNMARTQPPCRVMAHGKPNTSMKLYFRGHVCCHQIILWRKLQQH